MPLIKSIFIFPLLSLDVFREGLLIGIQVFCRLKHSELLLHEVQRLRSFLGQTCIMGDAMKLSRVNNGLSLVAGSISNTSIAAPATCLFCYLISL